MVIMIILLILCLPLILMLSLFTTTSVVSIAVDVPVNGIEIAIEEMVELDLDKGESLDIEYRITPTEASKKDVTVSFSGIGELKLADFIIDGNKITPISSGYARVTLETVDGGYRDSFDVAVYSKRVESIKSTPVSGTITVGTYTDIVTEYYPDIASNKSLSYRVKSGENVAAVSAGGRITGIGIGEAVIEVSSKDNPGAISEFTVSVVSSGVVDFVSNTDTVTALEKTGEIPCILNPEITIEGYEIELLGDDGARLDDSTVKALLDTSAGKILYTFTDEAFVGTVEIRLTVMPSGSDPVTKSCYLTRVSEISAEWKDQSNQYYVDASEARVEIDLKPLGADVSYLVTLDYTKRTGLVGNVQKGVAFELCEGEIYTLDGGYISIELESSLQGVFLVVRREIQPSIVAGDLENNFNVTYISLSVRDNHNSDIIVLEEISIVASP